MPFRYAWLLVHRRIRNEHTHRQQDTREPAKRADVVLRVENHLNAPLH
jgi:hypothetical protein